MNGVAWLPAPLVGEHVEIRRPVAADAPALVELSCDPRVKRFIGGPMDRQAAQAKAERTVAAPPWGKFVIVERATGEVAGSGEINRKRGPWEISYQLRAAWWGRGLASEAVTALVAWFFANTGENLLIAVAQEANARSVRLLERTGAAFTGTFEQYGLPQRRYEFHPPR